MRIRHDENGYVMWLSRRDTYEWAHKIGASWPCSTVSDRRFMVCVDENGLCDMTINGRINVTSAYGGIYIDGTELGALVSDHLPKQSRHLWPVWEITTNTPNS